MTNGKHNSPTEMPGIRSTVTEALALSSRALLARQMNSSHSMVQLNSIRREAIRESGME